MDRIDIEALAGRLAKARESGVAVDLPDALLKDMTSEEGYAVQRRHVELVLDRHGGGVIGTKLGGGDCKALAALGVEAPIQGPIFSAFSHDAPVSLKRADFFVCAVEAEIAVRLGSDLPTGGGATGRERIMGAIDAVMPALEIADTRLADFGRARAGAIIADAGFAGAFVRGVERRDWRSIAVESLAVTLDVNGTTVGSGSGAGPLGSPFEALAALISDLAARNAELRAGDIVSTGACVGPYIAKAGDAITADFGSLGRVSITFE
jgi:2-keto-4-pentenoate hydratase